jgi:hypothetical protein
MASPPKPGALLAAIACAKVNTSHLLGLYRGIASGGKNRNNFRDEAAFFYCTGGYLVVDLLC